MNGFDLVFQNPTQQSSLTDKAVLQQSSLSLCNVQSLVAQ